MLALPVLPLDTSAQALVEFCLYIRTVEGFVAVFEQKLTDLGGKEKHKGAAYEATEQLHSQLFSGQRKFKDKEVFYNARSRFYRENNS
jgi:hypothetical protein